MKPLAEQIQTIRNEHLQPARIELRRESEQKARDLLSRNLGKLSRENLENFLDALGTDLHKGSVIGDRFGPLTTTPNREKLRQSDLARINLLFSEVFAKEAVDSVDSLRSGIKGASYGVISCILYLKDPNKYNIFLKATSKGLAIVYPEESSRFEYAKPFGANYSAFNELTNRMRSEYSLLPQEVDLILTALSKTKEAEASAAIPVGAARETGASSIVDMNYVPPILQDVVQLAVNDSSLRSKYPKEIERVLEEKVWIAGRMLGFHVIPMGQGKGAVPDAVYRADVRERYVVLVDAKSRTEPYDMGTDYRTILDYLDKTGREYRDQHYRVYYTVVSHSFKDYPRDAFTRISKQDVARNLTFLTAEALLRLVELRLKEPTYGPEQFERVFIEGKIVKAEDIDDLLEP